MNEEFEEPRGPGTATKVMIGCGAAVFLSLLLCCGGLLWFGRSAVQLKTTPADIGQLSQSIASIDVPSEFHPQMGMELRFPVQMKMAVYERDGGTGSLVLMEMAIPGAGTEEQMEQSFQQQMRQQGRQDDIQVESREEKTFQIDGQERKFEFVTGTDPGKNRKVHRVTGIFPSRGATAFLVLTLDDAQWNEEEVTRMIESISTKPPR